MKKIMTLPLLICLILMITACRQVPETPPIPPDPSTYEKIQARLQEMVTYKAEAVVRYISNKGENEYTTIQHVRMTGEYRIEVIGPENVSGNITMSNGETIYQFNENIGAKISLGTTDVKERTKILLTSFLENYLKSDETSAEVVNLEEGEITILEASISGNHQYMSRQTLWIDNKTLNPMRLIVSNSSGQETIVVTYSSFEYNIELEDSLFILE